MSEKIDWSKAPADATHYQAATHGVFECWLKPGHAVRVSRREPDWREDDYADDLIATSAIKRPWSGEGLPPVGVDLQWFSSVYGWIGGKVVAHDEQTTIVRHNDGYEGCYLHNLKPCKTPEQIAADEREAAIERACADIEKRIEGFNVQLSYSLAIRATIEAMIDKGYRKP